MDTRPRRPYPSNREPDDEVKALERRKGYVDRRANPTEIPLATRLLQPTSQSDFKIGATISSPSEAHVQVGNLGRRPVLPTILLLCTTIYAFYYCQILCRSYPAPHVSHPTDTFATLSIGLQKYQYSAIVSSPLDCATPINKSLGNIATSLIATQQKSLDLARHAMLRVAPAVAVLADAEDGLDSPRKIPPHVQELLKWTAQIASDIHTSLTTIASTMAEDIMSGTDRCHQELLDLEMQARKRIVDTWSLDILKRRTEEHQQESRWGEGAAQLRAYAESTRNELMRLALRYEDIGVRSADLWGPSTSNTTSPHELKTHVVHVLEDLAEDELARHACKSFFAALERHGSCSCWACSFWIWL